VGCPFCATGQLGYRGNLSAQEIIEQVYWAGVIAQGYHRRLRNVVFMGMGEPLHNLRAVLESLTWLTDDSGFGLSPRHITVSTAGVPGAMLELIHRFPRVRLALSLHAVDRQLRRRLVPRAVGDLHLLRTTIEKINRRQPHPVWLEIVLFAGVNDTLHHAQLVRDFSQGLNVEVNLIPYNSAVANPEFAPSPRPTREAFATLLRESGIRTTLRTSFGSENSAACGQLTTQPSSRLTHFDEAAGK
jgi:23S rRNA (adenine2503-C2)-methyltransferase